MTKSVKLTWIIITINLFIAGVIISSMFGIMSFAKFFVELPLNFVVGFLGLYISGYFFGNIMESQINLKQRNPFLIGFVGLLIILLIGIFTGSSVGFIQEGLTSLNSYYKINDAMFDYYIKPLFWIILFGIIPTIVTGVILGKLIKNPTDKTANPK